jgi:hypothetical protein
MVYGPSSVWLSVIAAAADNEEGLIQKHVNFAAYESPRGKNVKTAEGMLGGGDDVPRSSNMILTGARRRGAVYCHFR